MDTVAVQVVPDTVADPRLDDLGENIIGSDEIEGRSDVFEAEPICVDISATVAVRRKP